MKRKTLHARLYSKELALDSKEGLSSTSTRTKRRILKRSLGREGLPTFPNAKFCSISNPKKALL